MRVLVCGGRRFNDAEAVSAALERLEQERGLIGVLIHGAASGADFLANQWARLQNDHRATDCIEIITYPADWVAHGLKAGPLRNQQMLDEGRPALVVAFPGGGGTRDMVRRARAAGVEVIEVKP